MRDLRLKKTIENEKELVWMESDPASTELFLVCSSHRPEGLFAMTEIAVITSRKARLEQRARRGDTGARKALEIGEDPTHLLSAIQVGITLVWYSDGIMWGAPPCPRRSRPFCGSCPSWGPTRGPWPRCWWWRIIAYATSLVFGELVPKRIAPQRSGTARLSFSPVTIVVLFPHHASGAVTFSSVSTKAACVRLSRGSDAPEHGVTEEEIRLVLAEGNGER
jgi:putative hemolysin